MRLFSNPKITFLAGIGFAVAMMSLFSWQTANSKDSAKQANKTSSLGAFSVSLTVKDLNKSVAFYKNLGFQNFADHTKHGYAIMKNGNCLIGLFQGMFDKNILTFNPGWDENAQELKKFKDIRLLESEFKAAGLKLDAEIDSTSKNGPASLILSDPDGNPILIDQHR